jgi:hypothetical protein
MLGLKPELSQSEVVLAEYGATVYMVQGNLSSPGSNIRLFLTNQRLILKAGFGPQRILSLSAIAGIREEKLHFHNMLRLEFRSGHLEWMTVQDQAQFIEALRSAQSLAPEIPEVYPQSAPYDSVVKKVGLGVGAIILIVLAVCLVLGLCIVVITSGVLYLRLH